MEKITTAIAILVGAAIIGVAILGAQFLDHYQLVGAAANDGRMFAWRLNTRTGEIQRCEFMPGSPASTPLAASKSPTTIEEFNKIDPDDPGPPRPRWFSCIKDSTP